MVEVADQAAALLLTGEPSEPKEVALPIKDMMAARQRLHPAIMDRAAAAVRRRLVLMALHLRVATVALEFHHPSPAVQSAVAVVVAAVRLVGELKVREVMAAARHKQAQAVTDLRTQAAAGLVAPIQEARTVRAETAARVWLSSEYRIISRRHFQPV